MSVLQSVVAYCHKQHQRLIVLMIALHTHQCRDKLYYYASFCPLLFTFVLVLERLPIIPKIIMLA